MLAVGAGRFFLPLYLSLSLAANIGKKIVQHMLRAIAVLYFPICAPKNCPAPAALAAGAGHYFSLTPFNSPFKSPYSGKAENDIS